jgi:hypothetical protein
MIPRARDDTTPTPTPTRTHPAAHLVREVLVDGVDVLLEVDGVEDGEEV